MYFSKKNPPMKIKNTPYLDLFYSNLQTSVANKFVLPSVQFNKTFFFRKNYFLKSFPVKIKTIN